MLAGVVETHGRAETEAADRRPAAAAAPRASPIAARSWRSSTSTPRWRAGPGLLLVDELAHTNAPGSRHAKRWEDVAELLAAGIDVWATLNVQHLESLNDDVARITGVRVTETLPDRVLEMADEIELIDVTPAELRDPAAEGKIYRPDIAARALDGFFREGNLAALREIALRRAAAHVDDDVRDWMRRTRRRRALAGRRPGAGPGRPRRRGARPWSARPSGWPTRCTRPGPRCMSSATPASPAPARRWRWPPSSAPTIEIRAGADLVAHHHRPGARGQRHPPRHGPRPGAAVAAADRPHAWRCSCCAARPTSRCTSFRCRASAAPAARRAAAGQGCAGLARRRRWLPAVTGGGLAAADVIPAEAMGMVYLVAVVVGAGVGGLRVAVVTAATASSPGISSSFRRSTTSPSAARATSSRCWCSPSSPC